LSCSNVEKAANLARMRPVRLQLALAYCFWQLLACADAHEPDDGISYHPKIGGPIVEFPGRRGGPIGEQTFDRATTGGEAGGPPVAIMVSPAGGGSTSAESANGAVGTGGVGGSVGGVAGGVAGPGGGTTGGGGGFSAGGTAGNTSEPPPACDAGALPSPDAGALPSPDAGALSAPDAGALAAPADAGAVEAGARGEACRPRRRSPPRRR
jgi:hypothetical protein